MARSPRGNSATASHQAQPATPQRAQRDRAEHPATRATSPPSSSHTPTPAAHAVSTQAPVRTVATPPGAGPARIESRRVGLISVFARAGSPRNSATCQPTAAAPSSTIATAGSNAGRGGRGRVGAGRAGGVRESAEAVTASERGGIEKTIHPRILATGGGFGRGTGSGERRGE